MQCTTPIRRLAGSLLVAAILTSLLLAPAAHAAPGATAVFEDGPAWVQRLPTSIRSLVDAFLDLLPGGASEQPVSVYERAGGEMDPNG